MQMRYRAAATALLLTATAGVGATGGTAQASGTHHPDARGASKLVVTIKTKAHGLKLSDTKIRPGNTMFKVKNAGGAGLIQLLRLKPGYDLSHAFADFGAAFPSGPTQPDVAAVRRIDKHVVFYGGMETPRKPGKANMWAVKIDKGGTYYAVNLDANALASLQVKGHSQKRSMPASDGYINAASGPHGAGNVFKPGKHNAAKGWMSTTNKAKEPHFVVLQHVKKGTTKRQVLHAFTGNTPPTIFLKGSTDTGVISPHHTFVWSYGLPKGRYAVTCFWPSKVNGMPHALMGMISVFNQG
jgi:hypothetical protein